MSFFFNMHLRPTKNTVSVLNENQNVTLPKNDDVYDLYSNYLKDEEQKEPENRYLNFKNNRKYTYMLEHVTENLGERYLKLILTVFTEITEEEIIQYLTMNDRFGDTVKSTYVTDKGTKIYCSPTSLRYVYQALVILDYYKTTDCENMAELGCGYGGLFLAINYFANILNIRIEKYNIIDLPSANNLIEFYLNIHEDSITIPYEFHESAKYGSTVPSGKLFFISNYCYTEIDMTNKNLYYINLLKRADHGFIIWQSLTFDVKYLNQIFRDTSKIEMVEEQPQTCVNASRPNYFVFF